MWQLESAATKASSGSTAAATEYGSFTECGEDDARRADNYRLRAVLKVGGQQVFNELLADSQGIITLPNLAAGTELDITVTGHNAVGESAPTAPVTGVLP